MTMIGLFSETSRAAERNERASPDRFHVNQNALGARIVAEIIDQIAPVHVEHRPGRDERAESHALVQAPIQNGGHQRAALADERDVARQGDALGESRVQAGRGIHDAQAIGADEPHSAARRLFQDPPFQFRSRRAQFPEPGGNDDGGAHARHRHIGRSRPARVWPGVTTTAKSGLFRQGGDVWIRLDPQNAGPLGIDRKDRPAERTADQVP